MNKCLLQLPSSFCSFYFEEKPVVLLFSKFSCKNGKSYGKQRKNNSIMTNHKFLCVLFDLAIQLFAIHQIYNRKSSIAFYPSWTLSRTHVCYVILKVVTYGGCFLRNSFLLYNLPQISPLLVWLMQLRNIFLSDRFFVVIWLMKENGNFIFIFI